MHFNDLSVKYSNQYKDPVWHHLPKLRPADVTSDDPDVNSLQAAENFFSVCFLAIFSNVLDPKSYRHPDVHIDDEPSQEQQEQMDLYDRNALSVEERNSCATARGLAYKLLDWFAAHYKFVPLKNQKEIETQRLITGKIGQQAYAIYYAKKIAIGDNLDGFPGCSLSTLEQQLRGTFSPDSHSYEVFDRYVRKSTAMARLHADFDKWELQVKSPSDEYVPSPKKDIWVKTPLDCKFEQGFKVGFQTGAGKCHH